MARKLQGEMIAIEDTGDIRGKEPSVEVVERGYDNPHDTTYLNDDLNEEDEQSSRLATKDSEEFVSEMIDIMLSIVVHSSKPRIVTTPSGQPKAKLHSCSKCDKKFYQFKSMKNHQQSCSGSIKSPQWVVCSLCKKSLSDKNSLVRHMRVVHNPLKETYQCDTCEEILPSKRHLKAHNLSKHEQGDSVSRCTVEGCNFEHKRASFVKAHMTRVHTDGGRIKCPICPFQCHSKSGMIKHMKSVHSVSSDDPIPPDVITLGDVITPGDMITHSDPMTSNDVLTHSGVIGCLVPEKASVDIDIMFHGGAFDDGLGIDLDMDLENGDLDLISLGDDSLGLRVLNYINDMPVQDLTIEKTIDFADM